MTKEEYRNYVYSKYRGNGYVITKKDVEPYSISGGRFLSPDTCYEMINEKRERLTIEIVIPDITNTTRSTGNLMVLVTSYVFEGFSTDLS